MVGLPGNASFVIKVAVFVFGDGSFAGEIGVVTDLLAFSADARHVIEISWFLDLFKLSRGWRWGHGFVVFDGAIDAGTEEGSTEDTGKDDGPELHLHDF